MGLDPDICYRAVANSDRKHDGRFFVGVKSTRIYCRPVCPARTPRRDRCEFFEKSAQAELAGYMPCLRCRPDLAPGQSSVDAKANLAKRAATILERNPNVEVEELAKRLGVTSRHLRRAMRDELGFTPTEFKQRQRIARAQRLLRETQWPVTRIAFDSGFKSLRRFNEVFRQLVGHPPSALRKQTA